MYAPPFGAQFAEVEVDTETGQVQVLRAVFAHDPTARNGGAVFLQALLMACDGDMDQAMSLAEGEDRRLVGIITERDVVSALGLVDRRGPRRQPFCHPRCDAGCCAATLIAGIRTLPE